MSPAPADLSKATTQFVYFKKKWLAERNLGSKDPITSTTINKIGPNESGLIVAFVNATTQFGDQQIHRFSWDGTKWNVGAPTTMAQIVRARRYDEPVTSSNLERIGYDGQTKIMWVAFKGGGRYEYFDVPFEVYVDLSRAGSKGKFFWSRIRRGGYAYRRVERVINMLRRVIRKFRRGNQ